MFVLNCSNHFINKKKLIAELDEYDFVHRKLTVYEEYYWTKGIWGQPAIEGVLHRVLQKYKENDKLLQIGSGVTLSEIREDNK